MAVTTNVAGVACCGHCGHELRLACSNGCEDPDIVFAPNAIAVLPIPKGRKQIRRRYPTGRKFIPGICTYRDCREPIAPREPGAKGRPHTKCWVHLELSRKWSANVRARQATE